MNHFSTLVPTRSRLTILICLVWLAGCQSLPAGEVESAGRDANSVIRATPYYFSGEHRGFRLYPNSDPVAFDALGLRPGDLLFEVEGRIIVNPRAPVELFKLLNRGDTVAVKVRREDSIVELSLKLN